MGTQEQALKKKVRNTRIQRAVLITVATAGVLAIAVLAPKALRYLNIINNKRIAAQRRRSVNAARARLVEHGLLEYKNGFLRLTEKGEEKMREVEIRNYKLPRPKRWDKHWRILIFDIKEERKSLRDKLRDTLVAIGFKRLQDSVWIYPYDCEDLIALLKADFKNGKDLLYIITDKLEYDKPIKQYFGLDNPDK